MNETIDGNKLRELGFVRIGMDEWEKGEFKLYSGFTHWWYNLHTPQRTSIDNMTELKVLYLLKTGNKLK